jgi:16S rRNA U516 pseudouridylate synthase RsuA-like enzyme
MKKAKLSNVVVLDKKMLNKIAEGEVKVDGRTNNTGRPVNKKSARQIRLNKQAFYADVNAKFKKGNQFKVNNSTYNYSAGKDGSLGCIVDTITGHVCNVSYIGRTKVQGYTFVLGKKVNVELNLKTLKFVK